MITAKVSQVFLSQQWFSLEGSEEKGNVFNRQVKQLVHSYLANSVNKLNTLVVLVKWVQKELEEEGGGKDWSLHTFPTIKRFVSSVLICNYTYICHYGTIIFLLIFYCQCSYD